jgi:hypothetical protein
MSYHEVTGIAHPMVTLASSTLRSATMSEPLENGEISMSNTRAKIVELIEWSEGEISDAELGRILGISRQGIHWHTRDMLIDRTKRKVKTCITCKRKLTSRNQHNMCRQCKAKANRYMFTCWQCSRVNVLTGTKAWSRRRADKAHPDGKDRRQFCNSTCVASYRGVVSAVKRKAKLRARQQQDAAIAEEIRQELVTLRSN